MNTVIWRYAGFIYAVIVGTVMSQCPSAWAGWTGNLNGTGYGWAQSSVTSVTSNKAVAATATNASTFKPSAAISPVSGYIATTALPKGASATTYSKTLTGTGYKLQNATVAAGGDKTDDNLLSTTGSQFLSATFLQVLGYTNSPNYSQPAESDYTFFVNTVGTDSGAAQLVRVFDVSVIPGFDPTQNVIVPNTNSDQFCWNGVGGCDCDCICSNIVTYCVSISETPGLLVGSYEPFAGEDSPLSFFNSSGGWQGQDSFSVYGVSPDPNYVFLDFHGTAASLNQSTGDTMIPANFNGTAISSNSTVWFNSVLKPNLPANKKVTISFIHQIITGLNGLPPVSIPDAQIIFDPAATCATSTFMNHMWVTTVPASGLSGNTFLSGMGLPLPAGLPGGIQNVTWSGHFISDTAGVQLQWTWAAAVYNSFPSNPYYAGVKATDDNHKDCSYPNNSDHAGTPENNKSFLTGGAGGGGGANYTGGLSGTTNVTPAGP